MTIDFTRSHVGARLHIAHTRPHGLVFDDTTGDPQEPPSASISAQRGGASFHVLLANQRREIDEATQGEGMSGASAFLLPLALSLSRLAARRHAMELA